MRQCNTFERAYPNLGQLKKPLPRPGVEPRPSCDNVTPLGRGTYVRECHIFGAWNLCPRMSHLSGLEPKSSLNLRAGWEKTASTDQESNPGRRSRPQRTESFRAPFELFPPVTGRWYRQNTRRSTRGSPRRECRSAPRERRSALVTVCARGSSRGAVRTRAGNAVGSAAQPVWFALLPLDGAAVGALRFPRD